MYLHQSWCWFLFSLTCLDNASSDSIKDQFQPAHKTELITKKTRFMIYDVNPGEGFNLRRDVFVRAANLINSLRKDGRDWVLVLPPWRKMYHWRSNNVYQEAVPWAAFFDLANINRYVPAIEFTDFMDYTGEEGAIDHVLYLQRHPDEFNRGFKDLVEIEKCQDRAVYHRESKAKWRGHFWNLDYVYAKKFSCVSAQGHATVLKQLFRNVTARSVLVDRFEQVLHIDYGSVEFFKARRSMVYARPLRNEGDNFREKFLNSTDETDSILYNEDWAKQIPIDGQAKGGPYIGVHMRRGDFTYAHKETIPSIKEVISKVKVELNRLKLSTVYLSTDGSDEEVAEFKQLLGDDANVHRYKRNRDRIGKYLDGGIAIIDQWIVAHARHFIGTCQSTFSFRIHEDRDILGFNPDATYNCICGQQSPKDRCEQPTRWRVKFS